MICFRSSFIYLFCSYGEYGEYGGYGGEISFEDFLRPPTQRGVHTLHLSTKPSILYSSPPSPDFPSLPLFNVNVPLRWTVPLLPSRPAFRQGREAPAISLRRTVLRTNNASLLRIG